MFKVDIRNAFSNIFKNIRIFSSGPFDVDSGYYAFILEEKRFIPFKQLKEGQLPTVFMKYEVKDNGRNDSSAKNLNEKEYNIILLNNGVPLNSTKREGHIYKSSAWGNNTYFESDVAELAQKAERLSKINQAKIKAYIV